MIHHAEMAAQADLIFALNQARQMDVDAKKWPLQTLSLTAAVQEDTPLKKHRLVLFSVSKFKDAALQIQVSAFSIIFFGGWR